MFKAALRRVARHAVRRMVASSWSREAINSLYLRLGPVSRTRFQNEFAKVFREHSLDLKQPASWHVNFAHRMLHLPLTPQNLWQEWDSAVSIVGNDMEVKQTYEALLASPHPPDFFVDIGANYGTHTLLFMAAGVPTLTFEPNPACHEYFLKACELNGFEPNLEKVALGREPGRIQLTYPPRDTWFGSTDAEAIEKLRASGDVVTAQVELRTLDDYIDRLGARERLLVKIDTEGNEHSVLQGGRETLTRCRPTIIFESLVGDGSRPGLHDFLASIGYEIAELPFLGAAALRLTTEQFIASHATNFIALRPPLELRQDT